MKTDGWFIASMWFASQWVMFGIGYLYGRHLR